MADPRLHPDAARALRDAIADADGNEVFAIGEVEGGRVVRVEVHARGTDDQVLALSSRPRPGQVVLHNHPSGVLLPSPADLHLASAFGEDGVGFVIVDNGVSRANWVVEPHARRAVPVDPTAVERFFTVELPRVLPGWEPRPGQVDMALRVAAALDEGGVVVLEAGTGTGKSLAYLVPAALWALANEGRVVVSTYTRTLQGQLVADDLPVLARVLGTGFRSAVLKGRGNYLCRRKLGLAVEEAPDDEAVARVAAWAGTSATGDVADAGFDIDDDLWERVESDTDQTLRARCPHFNACFYYQARRAVAAAHVAVVNHALLLSDLSVKAANDGVGILPRFDRVVLDEAHHLEEAATAVGAVRLSARSVARAAGPLLPRGRRPGALDRVGRRFPAAGARVGEAADAVALARDHARLGFEALGEGVLEAVRVRGEAPHAAFLGELADDLDRVAARLGAIEAALDGEPIPPGDMQPVLDLGRARRRFADAAGAARAFLADTPEQVRYLDPGAAGVAVARAPVDIGPFVRKTLGEGTHTTVLTSATLAVHGRIDHYLGRVGLEGAAFAQFPSPFDYARQAILATPRDICPPDAPAFHDEAAAVIADAIEQSRGGAFVLCTSHAAVRELSRRVEARLGGRFAFLVQGRGPKGRLLDRFREDRGSVLFGTDSFWEGVSVRGEALRLVVIPRLPFRVPTEPVAEARYERLRDQGLDPFRAYALPQAVLRLRQGFGRLIRSASDRGVVLLLDRRLHEMWYGRVFLASLPPARRLVGPSRAVIAELGRFYASWTADG